jgi:hypothetical protein
MKSWKSNEILSTWKEGLFPLAGDGDSFAGEETFAGELFVSLCELTQKLVI